jgi:hypothetical protein
MDLEQIVRTAVEGAIRNLAEDGFVIPAAILVRENTPPAVFLMPWRDEREKELSLRKIASMARDHGQAVVYVLESWISRVPNPDLSPSEDPDREEAVVVVGFSPNRVISRVVPFTRDSSGRPVPGEPEELPGEITSWFDPWPDREPVN